MNPKSTAPAPDAQRQVAAAPRRTGGLPDPGPGRLYTLFTLILLFATIDFVAMAGLPFMLHRFERGVTWTEPSHIGRMMLIAATGLACGAIATLMAHRRGRTPWWFLAGHAGAFAAFGLRFLDSPPPIWVMAEFAAGPLGLAFALAILSQLPPAPAPADGPLLRVLNRAGFVCGNVWWGLGQLLIIFVVLISGTVIEGARGTEAVQLGYYKSAGFGALVFLFAVTLACATLRKYPFRLSQTGWLVTHASLIGIIAGALIGFFGGYEGDLTLYEGSSTTRVRDTRVRDLTIAAELAGAHQGGVVARTVPVLIDYDRTTEDVRQAIDMVLPDTGREHPFRFTIDRYYESAVFENVVRDGGPDPRLAIDLAVRSPMAAGPLATTLLEGSTDRNAMSLGSLTLAIRGMRTPPALDAWTRPAADPGTERGKLIVRSAAGATLLEWPVSVPAGADDVNFHRLGQRLDIPGTDFEAEVSSYIENVEQMRGVGSLTTAAAPESPALIVTVRKKGAKAGDRHVLHAFRPEEATLPDGSAPRHPLRLTFRFAPAVPTPPSSVVFLPGPGDAVTAVVTPSAGAKLVKTVTAGESLTLPGSPLEITVSRVFPRAKPDVDVRNDLSDDDGRRALHVTGAHRGERAEAWLVYDAEDAHESQIGDFVLGGRRFAFRYGPRFDTLPFSLALYDVARWDHPGANAMAARYESHLRLRDPELGIDAYRLADMNHPLSHRGFMLYQARFDDREGLPREVTALQVMKDPGFPVMMVSVSTLLVGLFLVFFMKPTLRRIETARALRSAPEKNP